VLVRHRSRFLSSVLPSYLFELSSLSRASPPPPSVLPAREQVTGQVHPPGSCAGQASPAWIRFSSSPLSSCSLFSFLQQGRRAHLSRSWTKLPCPPLGHRPFSLFFSSACNVQSLPLVLILSFLARIRLILYTAAAGKGFSYQLLCVLLPVLSCSRTLVPVLVEDLSFTDSVVEPLGCLRRSSVTRVLLHTVPVPAPIFILLLE
jgi:hypothetical protein